MDRKKLTITVAIIFIGAFLIYTGFEVYKIVKGPELDIFFPYDGQTLAISDYNVGGKAQRISYISLNDRQIYTDSTGHFDEKLIALPGHNIITIRVSDRYGRIIEKKIRIYRTPQADDVIIEVEEKTASSTASTSPTTTSEKVEAGKPESEN